jgi:His-Xaa-Ser system protein HxsD
MTNILQINYDLKVFSLIAIKRALHDANIYQCSTFTVIEDDKIIIEIKLEHVKEYYKSIKKKLDKLVFDNQIRIDTEKEFKNIRNIIIAQAFFPCENLDEVLKDID